MLGFVQTFRMITNTYYIYRSKGEFEHRVLQNISIAKSTITTTNNKQYIVQTYWRSASCFYCHISSDNKTHERLSYNSNMSLVFFYLYIIWCTLLMLNNNQLYFYSTFLTHIVQAGSRNEMFKRNKRGSKNMSTKKEVIYKEVNIGKLLWFHTCLNSKGNTF